VKFVVDVVTVVVVVVDVVVVPPVVVVDDDVFLSRLGRCISERAFVSVRVRIMFQREPDVEGMTTARPTSAATPQPRALKPMNPSFITIPPPPDDVCEIGGSLVKIG
jgi:hypothetical protein